MTTENKKQITRKDFLKGVGVSVAGVAMAGSVAGLLTGCSDGGSASVGSGTAVAGAPEWPFKYVKLDPEKVKERAFNAYKERGGWGVGVAEGFLGELREAAGYPFDQIPSAAFTAAAGGYGGQGSLCGCIGVAAACIGLVADKDVQKKLLLELSDWYKPYEFPQYQPEGLNLPTTVADSILCLDSVGTFMAAHGVPYDHAERKSRCAGVTAETAGKMVELLNEHFGV